MAGGEEEPPQPGSVPNESQGAADGYITTLPDQGTTANGRYQIINLQNHRSFVVHVPFNADKHHRLPVVVAMHGYEMDAGNMFKGTDLSQGDAITVFVQGAGKAWAPAPYAVTSLEDDLKYVDDTIDFVRRHYPASETTYGVGFSNGGGFARAVTCKRPGLFEAVATVSAAKYDRVEKDCASEPTDYLDIHGTEDVLMKYSGGRQHGAHYHSVKQSLRGIAKENGCNPFPKRRRKEAVEHFTWRVCDARTEQYTIHGGTHTWNGGATDHSGLVRAEWTTDTVLDFFHIAHP